MWASWWVCSLPESMNMSDARGVHMALTADSRLEDLLATTRGRAILARHLPGILEDPNLASVRRMTLKIFAAHRPVLAAEKLKAILDDLRRPVGEVMPAVLANKSLDEIDNASYRAAPGPMAGEPEPIELREGIVDHPDGLAALSLDGAWLMAAGGGEDARLAGVWPDAIAARVPGSVHTALVEAGVIPDPTFGVNQKIARRESYKTWWLKRTFRRPQHSQGEKLIFGGVCNRCTVWLNGYELGRHEGMFGGPSFDVADMLREENSLVLRLDPTPFEGRDLTEHHTNPENNFSWRRTVVFNNVYGWHYSNLPSLGIWRPVKIEGATAVSIRDPFAATKDPKKGIVDLALRLEGQVGNLAGTLRGSIEPENFSGSSHYFEKAVHADQASLGLHLRFVVPDPHLWWPVDLGAPNLYRLRLSFTPAHGEQVDCKELTFGIRTIEMTPLPDGPRPDKYNWTFVINGDPHFIKGTGWCTMDPLMDFSRERCDRFLTLAAMQHVQMLRAWGSGMPETDEFYDLCNRKGIMVLQEWPTAWDSHLDQPYELLEQTVRLNTLRLRNNPCLAMWGAGNESSNPFGEAIDMMGRLSIELDGTRPFHCGEPWGGSFHDYACYWGRRHLDHNLNMTADFFGEFGLASMPMYESVQRYLPHDEKQLWPPPPDGSFAYHTPIFNTSDDVSRLTQLARYFMPKDCSMAEFTVGSQLAQAVGVRHPLELARTRWPECSGALYYKMNDNFPAASWSCADWYGAPKIGHYFFQDAFAPLHACVIFSTVNMGGTPAELPVFLLDDADALQNSPWQVVVRAFDSQLKLIKRADYSGQGATGSPLRLGSFDLTYQETDSTPLLIVAEVSKGGLLADRTFYWTNYESDKGCLFRLPRTRLSFTVKGPEITVKNVGELPAVAVNVAQPGHLDTFLVSDNYFWLDAGEEKTVAASSPDVLTVSAWNAA